MTYLKNILTSENYEQSAGNTSTTPLGSAATFTGTGELNGWSSVMVVCKTDNTGTIYFDFSPDGTNWDSSFPPLGFQVANGITEFHTAVKGPRYFRVRLINDTGAQSYLRLYTYYGTFRQGNLPLNATIGQDSDAIIVRPTDFETEVALNRYAGAAAWNKFGYNDAVPIGTEVIASFGGLYVPPTTASTIRFVSTDAADDGNPAGTGANGVVVYGIDGNRNHAIEIVTLEGLTPVDTISTWLGINRIAIFLAGSGQKNAGTITCTAVTGGATLGVIPIGEGTTQQLIYHNAVGHTSLVTWILLKANKQSGANPLVTFKLWVYSAVSNAYYEIFRYVMDTAVENSLPLVFPEPLIIDEKSVMWFEATSDKANTIVSGRFSLKEIKKI